jgi:hypothetical protein
VEVVVEEVEIDFENALMENTQCIYESPHATFNLDVLSVNKQFAEKNLKKVVEVIEDTSDYKIVKTGLIDTGWIFL